MAAVGDGVDWVHVGQPVGTMQYGASRALNEPAPNRSARSDPGERFCFENFISPGVRS